MNKFKMFRIELGFEGRSPVPEIKEVEIERRTDNSVWIGGRRLSRFTVSSEFHRNYQEARARLEYVATHMFKIHKAEYDKANEVLDKILSL